MRRLRLVMTGMATLALLAGGCGSTSDDDRLVLQFIEWDNTNITQADAVNPSNADVDVIQDLCPATGGLPTAEPFTQTVINAIFRNNEGSDILLTGYTTEIGNPRLTQANITNGTLSTNITGGRCLIRDRQCAVDSDCGGGLCEHSETTVSGIVLFDFVAKALIATIGQQHPEVFGQATPLKVTFFGSDPNRSFQVSANYLVTFGDFDNCMSTTGGTGGL